MSGIEITPDERMEVYTIAYCKETLAKTDSDQLVYVYDMDGNEIESATASSGKLTFTETYISGEFVKLFPRQAAPASADPYPGAAPVEGMTDYNAKITNAYYIIEIPPGGEQGDTVSLGTVYVRDVTATAPTLVCKDQAGNPVAGQTGATGYLNTTDTSMEVTLSAIDSDTWYGGVDFTDPETGYEYTGCIFVWRDDTSSQPISNAWKHFSTLSYEYYVFKLDGFADDADITDDDSLKFTVSFSTTLIASSNVVLDCYDIQKYLDMDNGVFAGVTAVTAITTKIA